MALAPYRPSDILCRCPSTLDAGWSSPVARWAHNPKVAGSNPAPATIPQLEFAGRGNAVAGILRIASLSRAFAGLTVRRYPPVLRVVLAPPRPAHCALLPRLDVVDHAAEGAARGCGS
jgi:hypothetical protein